MMNHRWKNKKVLVLGMGISGCAAAEFLVARGACVTGVEEGKKFLDTTVGFPLIHDAKTVVLEHFDALVVSPGIHPNHLLYSQAAARGMEIVGEVELALEECHSPVIGITGTNGKTTVTLLVTHVLNHAGIAAKAVGNVGNPITREIDGCSEETHFIAELSSFQLELMNTPVLNVAAVLNITPDHLDRYSDMHSYAGAKARIGRCLKPEGKLVISETTFADYRDFFETFPICTFGFFDSCCCNSNGNSLIYKENVEFILPLQYSDNLSHDVENMLAAYCICRECGVEPQVFFEACATFVKPRHRIEFVKNISGVAYYNDSKGTNIDAVIRAVQAMNGKTVLIAGGVDKGTPYSRWVEAFGGKVKSICAIGEAKEKIQRDLAGSIPVELHNTLEEAVLKAHCLAEPGEIVLLSPGCSSYDMFTDYSHRGDSFTNIVNTLPSRSSL